MATEANKQEVKLTKDGENAVKLAANDKHPSQGIIMTQYEGTTHRINIQKITPAQYEILKAKGHPYVLERKKSSK